MGCPAVAHWLAYSRAGILHRDISAGNILIDADGRHGLLIDWEYCKKLHHPAATSDGMTITVPENAPSKPRVRNTRTVSRVMTFCETIYSPISNIHQGTWEFMSAKLLETPGAPHGLEDDLESFFWVLLWVSLRYTSSNQQPNELSKLLDLFDEVVWKKPETGGRSKVTTLRSRLIPSSVQFKNPNLDTIFKELNDVFAARYLDEPDPQIMGAFNRTVVPISTAAEEPSTGDSLYSVNDLKLILQSHPIFLQKTFLARLQ